MSVNQSAQVVWTDTQYLVISVIWQDLGVIHEGFINHSKVGFVNEARPEEKYEVSSGVLDFSEVDFGRPKHRPSPLKVCVYKPSCSLFWCVWVSNIADGWSSLLRLLCKRHKWSAVSIRSSSQEDINWIQEMKILNSGGTVRCLRSMWDDREEFFSSGKPLFFEDVRMYSNTLIKERVTRLLIADYMEKMGIPVNISEFWSTLNEAVYLKRM